MKKLLLLYFLLFIPQAMAKTVVIQQPQAPQYLNYDGTFYTESNVKYPKIDELEDVILKRNYSNQPLEYRVARLEKSVYGAIQSGALNDRVERLLNSCSILAQNDENSDTSTISKAKSKVKSLGNMLFGGSLAGYTPPIYPNSYYGYHGYNNYNTYTPSYKPNYRTHSNPFYSYGSTSSWQDNYGRYFNNNLNTNSSTGIRIIR